MRMMKNRTSRVLRAVVGSLVLAATGWAGMVVDFEGAEVAKRVESWVKAIGSLQTEEIITEAQRRQRN